MAPFSKTVVGLVLLGLIVVSTAADSSGSESALQTVDISSRALASNPPNLGHHGNRALLGRVLSSKKSKSKSKKYKDLQRPGVRHGKESDSNTPTGTLEKYTDVTWWNVTGEHLARVNVGVI
ncbi:hypothetical protein BSKO_05586 [Bryopsis sp. KO-2023]|nr:hypothetical protein BSKO_05586 [Bryopsis sp. KO-2023]